MYAQVEYLQYSSYMWDHHKCLNDNKPAPLILDLTGMFAVQVQGEER